MIGQGGVSNHRMALSNRGMVKKVMIGHPFLVTGKGIKSIYFLYKVLSYNGLTTTTALDKKIYDWTFLGKS
jgi:hypothetical protein